MSNILHSSSVAVPTPNFLLENKRGGAAKTFLGGRAISSKDDVLTTLYNKISVFLGITQILGVNWGKNIFQ